ncbi:MAG: N-acetyl-gamma-glutamyl-phosphate reductase, partial [Acidimicrobiia bacterium]
MLMAYRAAVVGASGYTGAELLRLLAGHPEIEVVHVTADSNAGARVADLYPSLVAGYGDLRY